MTSVLIADDQALVRVGLRKILEVEPDTDVVGEAGDGEDAVREARRLRPDVVLMDIRMPVLDGIEATRRIVAGEPDSKVLILTTFGLDGYVFDAPCSKTPRRRRSPQQFASSRAATPCSLQRSRAALSRSSRDISPPRPDPPHSPT
jgi:CheY-like chemotaxis protein